MKKSKIILVILLVSMIPFAITLPMAQPAEAWGLQTHMFIVNEAAASITDEDWKEAFEFYLPELMAGSTTPDQAWQDWDNHLYYPDTGEHSAPSAAAQWYDYARANFTAEEWEKGFFAAGVMSHYFSDPCIPLHTGPGHPGHAGYESDINSNLSIIELTDPTETLIANVTQEVVSAATRSHVYYDLIVAAYPDNDTRALDQTNVMSATEECLSRAVNGTLSLFYTLTNGISAPEIVITYDFVAMFDYAHANDYSDQDALNSINQTLVRNHFQMVNHASAITAAALADVDLLVITCALNAYTADELTAISNWAASGNKSLILTARGDFSTSEDIARPNSILEAIGSDIRFNDDNVYMLGTYQPWYNDIYDIPDPSDTMGLTASMSSITLYSPTSLYFLDEGPVLPLVYGDESAYQTDQQSPEPIVVYDDTQDGINGNQIPLIAVEEIGELRLLAAGTTFFSDFDYGKTAIFSNIILLENFLDWSTGNRSEDTIDDVDEMGPQINDLSWSPIAPDENVDVTVSAEIIDISGVDTAWMVYDNGSETVEVEMSASGDTFSAVIPGILEGSIEITVYANDTLGNTAIRGVYTITWAEETTTPTAIDDIAPPPPLDIDIMVLAAAGIAVVIVLLMVVLILKKR
ncbi:MAG: zinc dependent phospholipase C family protein [Candidatus Thorarchaeota archaeon]